MLSHSLSQDRCLCPIPFSDSPPLLSRSSPPCSPHFERHAHQVCRRLIAWSGVERRGGCGGYLRSNSLRWEHEEKQVSSRRRRVSRAPQFFPKKGFSCISEGRTWTDRNLDTSVELEKVACRGTQKRRDAYGMIFVSNFASD